MTSATSGGIREGSAGTLSGEPGAFPCLKSTVQRPHTREAAVEKHTRQTGARGFAQSRAVENDLLVERQDIDVALEVARRDASGAGDHVRRLAECLLAAQIDDEDVGVG